MGKNKEINYNPPAPDIVRNYDNMTQYGRIGQNKYAGIFFEEFDPNLQGRRGIEVYKEMSENDDVIGAILFAIEMLVRQVEFTVEPAGDTKQDHEAAEFVKGCMDDMEDTWQDVLSEVLSFLPYGWSYHEICYKRRMGRNKNALLNSKYDDGLIGWQKLPIRAQETLWRWEYDEEDRLVGMTQMAMPDFALRTIPKEKALHFRTKSRKNNPEGKSILRNAYRSWFFKKRMQEIEGIGVERDLAGLPILHPPEDVDIWNSEDPDMVRSLAYAEKLVQNVRRDAIEGIVLPHGWEFELLNGGSKRQFEVGNIIERYDNRMAMSVLADFVLLGHQSVGSFALSSEKTELFSVAIGTYLKVICEAFNNQAIPRLIDLNEEHFKGITGYPIMKHGDIETVNLTEISTFLEKMIGIGLLAPEENLAKYVRTLGNLPDPVEGAPMPWEEDEEEGQESEGKAPKTSEKAKGNTNTVTPKEEAKNGKKEQIKEELKKAWEAQIER